jgi:tetratricopeptide (TPR) repeat protein
LKVLSALSAAGVAAVIPGLIDVNVGKGTLLAIRASGAIAVFLLVFRADPPAMIVPDEALRSQMNSNLAGMLLDDARRQADEILQKKPNDAEALNVKGSVAFYNGDYGTAASFFSRAHNQDPGDSIVTSNYANALVETRDLDRAIELFRSIDDGSTDRAFTLGRAYLYADKNAEAATIFERVPANYWRGAGGILQAAALTALAQNEKSEAQKAKLTALARQKFKDGYSSDRMYWDGIFTGRSKDVHLTYDRPVSLPKATYDAESAAS